MIKASAQNFLERWIDKNGARLELAAKQAALPAGFFDSHLHVSYSNAGKLASHLASNLMADIFGQQFGAGVHQR